MADKKRLLHTPNKDQNVMDGWTDIWTDTHTHTHNLWGYNKNSPNYTLEESNFNFRYARLWDLDLDVPKEKWQNYSQTVETLIRCRIQQSVD